MEHTALDHESGLALLTIRSGDLEPARLGPEPELRPGDPVFLLTCTGEKERRGASGHVTFVGPFEAFWEYMLDRAIMTTMVNPGLAGGPLFDARGRVAGVVSLGLAAVGRFSLAIPISMFLERRERLEHGLVPAPAERRAWIGFYPQASEDGIAVSGVVPGGPAEAAGLAARRPGGEPRRPRRSRACGQLYEVIWERGPGEVIGMQVLRGEAIQVVQVLAGDRYEFFK